MDTIIVGGLLFLVGGIGAAYGFKVTAESTPGGPNAQFWTRGTDLKDLSGHDPFAVGSPKGGSGGTLQTLTTEAQLYRWTPVGLCVLGLLVAFS